MPSDLGQHEIGVFKAKRKILLDELHSDEHYQNTETVAYGSHDPFDIPIMKCDKCGNAGEMQKEIREKSGNKYFVKCIGCGNFNKTVGRTEQQATLLWNLINPNGLKYTDFPLFGLSKLTPEQARVRMIGIRRNLEIRENLAALETTLFPAIGRKQPSNMYRKRLKLYVHWAMWAQSAIRAELPQKYRKSKHTAEDIQ